MSIHSLEIMLQMWKDLPDVYTRVSSFLAWINATILSNGGLASCNFSLTAEPSQGRIKSRNHININLIQDQSVPLSTLVLYNTVQSLNKKCTLLLTGHSAWLLSQDLICSQPKGLWECCWLVDSTLTIAAFRQLRSSALKIARHLIYQNGAITTEAL